MSRAGERPALTRDHILRQALAVIDREGLDALTMRRLGAELHVDPMAVYRHVPNKAALLDGVAEVLWSAALDEEALDPDAPWRDTIRQAMTRLRATLLRHPNALPIVATHSLVTDQEFAFLERALGVLEAAGLKVDANLLYLMNDVALFTIGHVLAEAAEPAGGAGGVLEAGAIETVRARHPRLARLLALTEAGGGYSADEQYLTGLCAILDGWPA